MSSGAANCVGRALALHEIRVVVAALVRRYDIRFAPGFQPSDWTDHLTDQFALVRTKLPVVLSKRV
jgi:cytochrome P450